MSKICVVVDGVLYEFPSAWHARAFCSNLDNAVEKAIAAQNFDNTHLSRRDVIMLMEPDDIIKKATIGGKAWGRLFAAARYSNLVNMVCYNCGRYVHLCGVEDKRCFKERAMPSARLEVDSLLRNRDEILDYHGHQVGPATRRAFQVLIEAVEAGLS